MFKVAREILHSHLEGLILVPKAAEEIHPTEAQGEENDEGVLGILIGVDQATEVDERLSTHA